uniref:Uncharacterized protein n=1 Tax=Anguilla anguilla TaxID=7936 RepID=A0A0E9WWC6_ANGAN
MTVLLITLTILCLPGHKRNKIKTLDTRRCDGIGCGDQIVVL